MLCVGTELVAGKPNTHSPYLCPQLRGAGLDVERCATLKDSVKVISEAVSRAAARADVVLVCGGLGPTFDDLTREGVSDALGLALAYKPGLYRRICAQYRRYRMRLPAGNKRQAWVLEGARVLDNRAGSAPGQLVETGPGRRRMVVLLPGPLREMQPMFERDVLPLLRSRFGRGVTLRRRRFRFSGVAEAAADRRLRPLLEAGGSSLEYTMLGSPGLVDLYVSARGKSVRDAEGLLDRVGRRIRRLMGERFYGVDEATLASEAGDRLRSRGWSLAAAESCTGGMLSEAVTAVPGSSDYFLGGAVCYHNRIKASALGVREATLKRRGAVSAECAREMARGARGVFGAEVGVSVTGIAGPGGGTRAKPVGLAFVGLSLPGRTLSSRFLFQGDRRRVRQRAVNAALRLLLKKI